MARKPRGRRKAAGAPPQGQGFDEKSLTKGQLRKLNALRNSVGEELGTAAFAKWLARQEKGDNEQADKNADLIAEELVKLIDQRNLRIPRGGYRIARGRGRVIVSRPEKG